jgi:hypothetical protein
MLPTDNEFGGWAASGEIDIMEARGDATDRVEGTLHYSAAWPNNRYTGSGMQTFEQIPDFSTGFHDFELKWEPEYMTWSVDGEPFNTIRTNRTWCESPGCPYQNNGEPWNKDFHMLLNLAVGGNYLAGPDEDDHLSWSHDELVIDSVRVYTASGDPLPPLPTCTVGGLDPWLNGPYIPCCEGVSECLDDWGNSGNYYYLCLTEEDCAKGPDPPTPPPGGYPECTDGGLDPYRWGPYIECCEGVSDCLGDWANNGNWFYLCLNEEDCAAGPQEPTLPPNAPECTDGGLDPYMLGAYLPCCEEFDECVNDWAGDGNWFYLCLYAEDCPTSTADLTTQLQ